MALLVAVFMPENPHGTIHVGKSKVRRRNSLTLQAFGLDNGSIEDQSPLISDADQNP